MRCIISTIHQGQPNTEAPGEVRVFRRSVGISLGKQVLIILMCFRLQNQMMTFLTKSLIKMEVPAKGKSWTSSPDGHLPRPVGSPICPSLTEDGEKRQGSRVEGKDQWWRYLHTHSWNTELAIVTSQKRASFASFYLPKWQTGKEFSWQRRRCGRLGLNHWVGKIPWKRKWQPTPVFLPRKFYRYRSLMGYSQGFAKSWVWLRHTDTSILHWRRLLKSKACLPRTSVWESPPGREYTGNWIGDGVTHQQIV